MHAPPSQFTGEHMQIVVVCCKKKLKCISYEMSAANSAACYYLITHVCA